MIDGLFDPLRLTAGASLNQVVIGDLASEDISGKRAGDLCSRDALHELAVAGGLDGVRPDRLSDDLGAALASRQSSIVQAATAALRAFGTRVGALIATLRSGSTAAEQGGTPWRRAYLSHWLTVDSVWLAGGLLKGVAGEVVLDAARLAASAAEWPCTVELSPQPALAPLIGAARLAPASSAVAVADFGHTSVKAAVVERQDGAVDALQLLLAKPAPSSDLGAEMEGSLVSVLVPAVVRASRSSDGAVAVIASVACYVADGLPIDDGRSVYARLADRSAALRDRVAEEARTAVTMEFVHDGTAAACVAGQRNSATITAGTWLGVGFDPPFREPPLRGDPARIRVLPPNAGAEEE